MFKRLKLRKVLLTLLVLVVLSIIIYAIPQPSHNRDWVQAQRILPQAIINGDDITIKNVRNNRYTSTTQFVEQYEDRTYKLSHLEKVWFLVTPFSDNEAVAHTFLSFQFGTDEFLTVSVEGRREVGETYSPIRGILKGYELMYVLADEQDAIAWRTDHYELDTFVYPIVSPKEFTQKLFVDILQTVNDIYETPRFYNTITAACNGALFKHMNNIRVEDVPWSTEVVFAGYADRKAHELGLIDTALPYEKIRARFNVKQASQNFNGEGNYSRFIRKLFID